MPVYLTTTSAAAVSEIVHFDLDMGHAVDSTSEPSEHPVELGANIVDHVRQSPKEITLRVYVTNTPIVRDGILGRGEVATVEMEFPKYEPPVEPTPGSLFRLAGGALSAIGDAIFGGPPPAALQVLIFNPVFDRVAELEAQLERLQNLGAPLNVITPTKFHENMVITHVSAPREEYGGAEFEITLRQIRLVTNAIVSAPQPLEPRGAPAVAKGSQSAKPLAGKDATSAKSWAAGILDALPDAAAALTGG